MANYSKPSSRKPAPAKAARIVVPEALPADPVSVPDAIEAAVRGDQAPAVPELGALPQPMAAIEPVSISRADAEPAENAAEAESSPAEAAAPAETSVPDTPLTVAEPAATLASLVTASPVLAEIPSPPSQPVVGDSLAATSPAAPWQPPYALEGKFVMNEAIETTKKIAEDAKVRFQSVFGDINDKTRTAMEKSSRAFEELSELARGNLEAVVESSKIAAKGAETLSQGAAEYGRTSFEKTSATLKSFASVKSPTEFFQLHSEFVNSTFDALASETARNSEALLKLAGDIAQPLSNRVAVVSDKIKTLAV